jgi:hypothetical protein
VGGQIVVGDGRGVIPWPKGAGAYVFPPWATEAAKRANNKTGRMKTSFDRVIFIVLHPAGARGVRPTCYASISFLLYEPVNEKPGFSMDYSFSADRILFDLDSPFSAQVRYGQMGD